MYIVLLGPPGSGKGTQAQALADAFGLAHVATGDLFRHHLAARTELGCLARQYIDRGALVPDEVTVAMVREHLRDGGHSAGGALFDGFPRTLAQAAALDGLLAELGGRLAGAILLDVSDAEVVRRIAGRRICRECQVPFHLVAKPFAACPQHRCQGEHLYQRPDDLPETVLARLEIYHRETAPLVGHYRDAGALLRVDGEGAMGEVAERMRRAVEALAAHNSRAARAGEGLPGTASLGRS